MAKALFTLIILFPFFWAKGQGTTEIEYNYIQNSLKDVIKNGGDIKVGYYLKDFATSSTNSYDLTIKKVVRKNGTSAGLYVQFTNKSFGGLTAVAVPAYSKKNIVSYGWEKYYARLKNLAGEQKDELVSIFSTLAQVGN